MNNSSSRKRLLSATDLYALRFAHDVALALDGSQIACVVMRPDERTNRNCTSIWVVSLAENTVRQVTSGKDRAGSIRWSPDGSCLAFVRSQDGKAQIDILHLAHGDEALPLTHHHTDQNMSMPCWSPDGTQMAYLCHVPSLREPISPVMYPDDADKPRVLTRARYKFDGEGFFDHTRAQLFVVSLRGGRPRQLTTGPMSVSSPAWSPDGTRLAFVCNREVDEDHDTRSDIWTVELATGSLTRVTPHDGSYGTPTWSPDGQALAVLGVRLPNKSGAHKRLWIVPAAGGSMRQVTDFDRSIGAGAFGGPTGILSDTGAYDRGDQLAWVGGDIYFLAAAQGTTQVWRVPATGGVPMQLTSGQHAIARWDISRDGTFLAFCASTPTNPGEIFSQSLAEPGEAATRRTSMNGELLASLLLSEVEEFWVSTGTEADGQVQGWILKPPHFSSEKRYPLLLEIHGGPAAAYGYGWFHEFQCFAAQGYVVVYINPHGSQGYGEAFATCIYQDWPTQPMRDLMAAVDEVMARGYVDPEHLYVTGGSYGGYMTTWMVTHTHRFRAAATQRTPVDLGRLALTDPADYTSCLGGMPWEIPDIYMSQSPITYIANCHTPLFIEHEEEDYRCPVDQAEWLYSALHALGVETELVLYPHESHDMSRNGKPLHRVDRLLRLLGWFERHRE